MKNVLRNAVIFSVASVFASHGFAATPAPSASKTLIVPGQSIGDIVLGVTTDKVEQELGAADHSDNAMGGKETVAWYLGAKRGDKGRPFHRPGEIGFYAHFNQDGSHRIIEQIYVTSPRFATAEGIATGSTLDAIRLKFPDIQLDAPDDPNVPSIWPLYGEMQFYLDKKKCIAFEIRKSDGVCIEIGVIPKGAGAIFRYTPIAAEDYTIHPERGTLGDDIKLGMTGAKLISLLGKPDEKSDTDAAHGGSVWRWRVPAQGKQEPPGLCIFLWKLPDGSLIADQIRLASPAFMLGNKIFPGCPLKDALEAAKNMVKIDTNSQERVDIYGGLPAGVLVEVRQSDSVCTAITILPALPGLQ